MTWWIARRELWWSGRRGLWWYVERTTWSVVERSVADTVVLTTSLEQLVVTMQGEVPQVRTAAAQAEQRATEALVLGVRESWILDRWGNQGS